MNRRLLIILIILMSLSLTGIIFVQGYWIHNSIEDRREQFSFAVKQTLASVAKEIESEEIDRYYNAFDKVIDSLGVEPNLPGVVNYLTIKRNENPDETITYSSAILSENYKLSPQILSMDLDSIMFTKLINRKVKKISRQSTLDGSASSAEQTYSSIARMTEHEKKKFGETIKEYADNLPLNERLSTETVHRLLEDELDKRDIDSKFEYAVYQDDLATRVQSDNFEISAPNIYGYELFATGDESSQISNYTLYVNLSGTNRFIFSSILGMGLLSLIFTFIIVIAYWSALSQLIRQRQISQIKTDFINNMTHEFKTPIATINLALDSLKHPKISSDPDKVSNYLRMIREENKRMHAQVENVLRISKLERNELNIQKEPMDLNDLIESSISHVQLILEECSGTLDTHLGALSTEIMANESHLTNVIVNILENAIKYTEGAPVIDVYTENVKNTVVIKIRDQGIGMTKVAQRKVFEKFFREHTGDIHNVKGHGLGLAYAKRIIEDHDGEIHVESEKGKGSTFTILIPTIT